MEQEIPPKRKRDWAFILTPCLFITVFLTIILLSQLLTSSDAMGTGLVMVVFLPPLMLALFGDIGSRLFLYKHENRGKIIWIVQTIMMIVGFILWKVFVL
jgi:hypothetical protein